MERQSYKALVIGASAGGLQALDTIFRDLPADFPLPILVVQHIHANARIDFCSIFCHSALKIAEAEDKQKIESGTIYFAPPGYHLLVETDHTLALNVDDPVNWARPSIDVLFESAAYAFEQQLIGLILTGANRDGAHGLKTIKTCRGLTLVQSPASAEIDIMPRAALSSTQVDHVLDLGSIGPFLSQIAKRST